MSKADLVILEYDLNDDARTAKEVMQLAHITEARLLFDMSTSRPSASRPWYLRVNTMFPLAINAESVHQRVCDV